MGILPMSGRKTGKMVALGLGVARASSLQVWDGRQGCLRYLAATGAHSHLEIP